MAGAGLPGEGLLVGAWVNGLESYACAQRGGVYDAFVRQQDQPLGLMDHGPTKHPGL